MSDKLIHQLVRSYNEHESTKEQVSRIILQIYSHYPVREVLNKEPLRKIIFPLLLNSYKVVN